MKQEFSHKEYILSILETINKVRNFKLPSAPGFYTVNMIIQFSAVYVKEEWDDYLLLKPKDITEEDRIFRIDFNSEIGQNILCTFFKSVQKDIKFNGIQDFSYKVYDNKIEISYVAYFSNRDSCFDIIHDVWIFEGRETLCYNIEKGSEDLYATWTYPIMIKIDSC